MSDNINPGLIKPQSPIKPYILGTPHDKLGVTNPGLTFSRQPTVFITESITAVEPPRAGGMIWPELTKAQGAHGDSILKRSGNN